MLHVTVVLLVLFKFGSTNSLNLCDQQSLVSTNLTSYKYKNEQAQNCNCTQKTSCIRKCCAVGFYATKGSCLRHEDPDFVLKIPVYNERSFVREVSLNNEILAGVMNCDFFLFPKSPEDPFYVQDNGNILTYEYGLRSNDNYCVEQLDDRGVHAFFCYIKNSAVITTRKINAAGMIISMPFLLLTFLAYALLPDRNLHMKALMIYVINLMMGYLLLVIIQLTDSKFSQTSCILTGIFCLFFFMVSFFWMNIICIDIWLTFSGLRGFSGSKKKAEQKRFYIYCGYGLGVPFLLVLTVYLIDVYAAISPTFKPGIGYGKCFLQEGYPELLYFYGPIAFLITTNIVLFIITAFKIRSIKKDTSMLKKADSKRHSYENDKQTFNLYVKLLFAMGINWSMEIISWLVLWQAAGAPQYLWYLTDFCNALYGVFIFFIFVFKRSTWKLLKKRYYSFIGKPHLAHSLTITNTTRVTSYSTANSSIHGDPHGGATDTSTLTSGV